MTSRSQEETKASTVRSTLHQDVGSVEMNQDHEWHSSDDDENHGDRSKSHDYVSTNLIGSNRITLADVISEEVNQEVMNSRLEIVVRNCRSSFRQQPLIDPRKMFKDRRQSGLIDSLVPFEDIVDLARRAEGLMFT